MIWARGSFTGRGREAVADNTIRKSNFPLRLQPCLLDEERKLAEAEGVALNQLINVAVAEKLSALRTESYFAKRGARADTPRGARSSETRGGGE
jgi:hypothetical protein